MLNKNTLIIFLDIDGVMCKWSQEDKNNFDKDCVKKFNNIFDKYDYEIVLSSDWRRNIFDGLYDCQVFFKKQGMSKVPFTYTPYLTEFYHHREPEEIRAAQINEFNKIHNKNNKMKWLVLDDLNIKWGMDRLREYSSEFNYYTENNLVKTLDSILDEGKEEEIINKIKELLK